MKVIPSNQTLILAGERGSTGTSPTLRTVAGEAWLKRVTVTTSQPDEALVYLPTRLPSSPRSNSYGSSRGVALYASTERLLTEATAPSIDLHA